MVHICASIELFLLVLLSGAFYFQTVQHGFCNADVNVGCMKVERRALLKLKQNLTDPMDRLSSWVGEDCCKWRGVGCSNKTGRVISLNLRNPFSDDLDGEDGALHALGGEINPSLLVLQDLIYLDFSMNNFESLQLPSFIGSVQKLKYLNLSGASFGGVIPPNIGNLSRLVYLDLSNNFLESDLRWLPNLHWLFNLTELVNLDLSSNNMKGDLPERLGSLTHLKNLDMSANSDIGGQLPRSLGMLCNLQSLTLSMNKVTGEITDFVNSLSRCSNSSLERLDLGYNNLTGNLPTSLGHLKNLRYLTLWHNSFQGSIPESIGNLTSLEEFYLTNNQMGGVIPESFGLLSSLVAVDLSENTWEGVITEAHFNKLLSLKEVSMRVDHSNLPLVFNISSDWIPPFKLKYLSISSCQLGPKFPTWLKNQTELSVLGLIGAGISDTIPDWFFQLDLLLDDLDFSSNQLSGRVPNSLRFTVRGITDLSGNLFEGPFPLWSSNISGLYLNDNAFSGPIPHDIGEVMPLLEDVQINKNSLTGNIPLSIGNLSHLTTLVISDNHFSGVVPDVWNSLSELYIVDMSNNSLSGAVPRSMGSLSTLRFLILSNNKFSGKLPSLENCTGLKSLDLGENKFSGHVPAWIGERMLSLWILRMSSNSFTGNIPSQLCRLSNLHILDLSNNDLVGHIPPCVGNLSGLKISEATDSDTDFVYQGELEVVSKGRVLAYDTILYLVNSLDLSNNKLSGEMPVELTSLIMLGTLNLSMNQLTGMIPEKIGNLKSIETLDLSLNKLWGSIPQSMVSLTFISHLNLSHNNLSGKIPTSNQFNSLIDPSIYQGNAGLCGDPLPIACRDNEVTPHVPSEDGEDGDDKSEKVWFIIITAVGFILGFWVVFGSMVINKTWRYAYFRFLDRMKYAILDFVSATKKCLCRR